MEESNENIQFQISDELIEKVEHLIDSRNDTATLELLNEFHHADIAEILEELNFEQAIYVIKLLTNLI